MVALDGGERARLTVAPVTIEDGRELFEVVAALEAAAARRTAMLPADTRVRVSTELVEINGALLRQTQSAEPAQDEIFRLDTAFHHAYVRWGAGPRTLTLHDAVKPQAERYIRLYISMLVDRISDSIPEHDVTIQGIRAGDVDAAERAVLVNWRNAAERLSIAMARLGERGTW